MGVRSDASAASGEVRFEDFEQHRRELAAYCYRMLGSAFESDDAVQETMVRAWKGIDGFEGRSAVRSWLYRIATNVCLGTLRGPQRRALAMDLGPSGRADSFTGATRPVFGFSDLDHAEGEGWRAVLLIHPQTSAIIELRQHDGGGADAVDPAPTAFDHLGLRVDDRSDLDRWQAHFERLDVSHTPTVDRRYGSVLTFCDPDGIQLELFAGAKTA